MTKGDSYLQCIEERAGNDVVTRRGREIFLVLGELDKQLLREEAARPHAALSLPLLIGFFGQAHFSPLSAEDICQRAFQIQSWQDTRGQPAPQLLCVDVHTLHRC